MIEELKSLFGGDPIKHEESSESPVSLPGNVDEPEGSIADYYKKHPIAQEQHHAMHALTLFYFMIHKALQWLEVRHSLLEGIIRHLKDLREFLEDSEITELVNDLWRSLERENAKPFTYMYPWFVANQDKVLQLAKHYGKEDIFRDLIEHRK